MIGVAAALLLSACVAYHPRPIAVPPAAPYLSADGKVRVVGYNDMDEMLSALAAAFGRLQRGVSFAFDLPSTRAAPPALIAGRSAFAPMGAEMTAADQEQFRQRYQVPPIAVPIAGDSAHRPALSSPLAVYVQMGNPLRRMTLDQLARAFAGTVRNWGELGVRGRLAGQPIHLYGPDRSFALSLFFRATVLPSSGFAPDYREAGKSPSIVAAIAHDPLALGFADLSDRSAALRLIALAHNRTGPWHDASARDLASGNYPLDRQLLLYVPPRTPVARAFAEFALSCAGQRIVGSGTKGYRPLDPQTLARARRRLAMTG